MQTRLALSPWLVAALFAPAAFLVWAIGTAVIPLAAKDVRTAFQAIALFQLFLAVMVHEILQPGWDAPGPARPAWQRLLIAAGVLVITQVAHLATADKGFASIAILPALAVLAQQTVTIALAEEMWFRGLWMRAAEKRPLLAIFGGAAGFGLYHLHQGAEWIATTAALGLLFAVARWYGAPIWALALAHGLMNWLNMVIVPGARWRFDPTLSRSIFIGLILFGAAILWLMCREPRQAAIPERE